MLIDFHAHCFPPRIAAHAMQTLTRNSAVRAPYFDGTPEGLRRQMQGAGIDRSVVLNIATNPKQQHAVNDFAMALHGQDGLLCFGSVHPFAPDAIDELRRIHAAGLPGIKLHPDYQGFACDDPAVFPVYHEAAKLGLITVFHAGVDLGLPDPVHASPRQLAAILPQFAGAPVVAAHWGGYLQWQEVLTQLCGLPIYFDTAFGARKIPPAWAREMIARHGSERILFGTDTPWVDPEDEVDFIRQISPSDAAAAAILGGNASRLLGLA